MNLSASARLRRASVLFALVPGLAAVAQTPPATPTPPKEEPIRLTTFTVTSARDYGYQATNSITATRIGTAIKDIPINLNVLTGEFIQDTGAQEMNQLLNRVSSVNTTNREDDKNDKTDVTIRGFPAVVLLNGYEKQFNYPLDFIERAEVIKGPNAVFYGRVSPGGAVNFITKRPQFDTHATLSATYGSYDFVKGLLDVTGPLNDKFAYRIFGSWRENDGWIDYTEGDENTLAGALTWKLSEKAEFNVNYARNDTHTGYLHSAPRGHPQYNLPSVDPSIPINTYIPNLLGPLAPWSTIYIYDLTYGAKGKEGNYSGPDNYSDRLTSNADAAFTLQPASWLTLREAFGWAEYWGERLILGGFPAADGSIRQSGTRDRTSGEAWQFNSEAVAAFDVGPTQNRLLVGYEYRELDSRSYVTARGAVPTFYPKSAPAVHLNQYVPGMSGAYGLIEDRTNALYLSNQTAAFSDRLHVLFGARWTQVKSQTGNQAGITPGSQQKTEATVYQAGAIYHFTPGLSLYANYSESFQPQPNLDVDGRRADPTEGQGFEAGLKTDLLDGKLSGSVAVYQVERSKIARRDFARELIEQRGPYFILGGIERTEGVELDLTYSPANNYQLMLSLGHMWEAKTVADPQTPGQVGRRLANTPEYTLSVWNRYTFKSGALKGLALGGGFRYSSEHYAHPLYQIGIVNPSYTIWDAFAVYPSRLFGQKVEYRLTVNNLFDEDDYYPGTYIPGSPRKIYASLDFKF